MIFPRNFAHAKAAKVGKGGPAFAGRVTAFAGHAYAWIFTHAKAAKAAKDAKGSGGIGFGISDV